jgi:DNA-binding response OmpR family regulator
MWKKAINCGTINIINHPKGGAPIKRCYVAIETDTEFFEFYRKLWQEHGVEGLFAGSMSDGIEQVTKIERARCSELLFVSIVADQINFLPQLRILRARTSAPILIATSKANYSDKEHHDALNNGADFYAEFCSQPELNINGVLAAVNSANQRSAKPKRPKNSITHGDIYLDADFHKVFIKDKEIPLSSAEMRILRQLLSNRGQILTHKQICDQINAESDVYLTTNAIYSAIKRLRHKMRGASDHDYIETIRNAGYRLNI